MELLQTDKTLDFSPIPLAFQDWMKTNYPSIVDSIQHVFGKKRERIEREDDFDRLIYYDPDLRAVSEMPLCESLKLFDTLPSGYCITEGSVHVKRYFPSITRQAHHFMINGQNHLVCLFPGQFVGIDDENMKPGDRLAKIKSEAPDLVTVFPNGLAIVHGSISEVDQRLGLEYIPGM